MLDNTIKKVYYKDKEIKVGDILKLKATIGAMPEYSRQSSMELELEWEVQDIKIENDKPSLHIILNNCDYAPQEMFIKAKYMTEFEKKFSYYLDFMRRECYMQAQPIMKACYEFFVENADTIKSNEEYVNRIFANYITVDLFRASDWSARLLVQLHKLGIVDIRRNNDMLYKQILRGNGCANLNYTMITFGSECKPILDLYEIKFKPENIPEDYDPEKFKNRFVKEE